MENNGFRRIEVLISKEAYAELGDNVVDITEFVKNVLIPMLRGDLVAVRSKDLPK